MSLSIETTETDGIVVMKPAGPIDGITTAYFREALRKAALGASKGVICDLSLVEFATSSFFGALLASRKNDPGRLIVAAIHPELFRTFKLAKLDHLLTVCKDVDEAFTVLNG